MDGGGTGSRSRRFPSPNAITRSNSSTVVSRSERFMFQAPLLPGEAMNDRMKRREYYLAAPSEAFILATYSSINAWPAPGAPST
jgi:hypothetical protein